MGSFHGTREIIELEEGVEDEINRLFETIRVSAKTSGLSQVLKDKQKKPMKRPMRGIGISEPVSLKQALRGLTISQASEMAAMKRLTKSKPGFEHVKRSQIAAGDEVNDNNISHQDRSVMELGQIRNLKLKLSSLSTRSKKIKPKEEANKPDPIKETKKKPNEKSRTQEKGEISQSSKSSSHGECSSSTTTTTTTSYSCDSNRSWCRPHMSKDLRWEAVNLAQKHHGSLNLRNFKLIKKIGGGDIGNVYLAELIGSNCLFALKILDNELLGVRKKDTRVQNEKEILQLLDHPFLPTLFSQFTTDKYSCFVIEYCPGGDLHVLRQKQPNKCFSEQAARFYVAEILLALEYLHMHGIIYRDLKPENILIREDGHIMLTDFDLSLRCDPNPTVINPSPSLNCRVKDPSSCIDPFCLQPSCFTTPKPNPTVQITPFPQVIVEPSARSNSFVGTHEYLAPEIINNEGHGSCVDWWTFGILLYEFLYGRTPFKGTGDEDTLANVVSQGLVFPESPIVSFYGKDLIRSLLRKQAEGRLGAVRGAAEIKEHKFFEGLNWALIRCATPPEMPKIGDVGSLGTKNVVFDMF